VTDEPTSPTLAGGDLIRSEPVTRSIVVGVDGSASSDTALDWAASQAAAEDVPLVLLTAVSTPAPRSAAWLAAHGIDELRLRVQLKEDARALLRRCDRRVHEAHPDLVVEHDVRCEDARDALLDADAGLLVVGTRGLGPVSRLLVGSVASTVVKHGTCPTVVVRSAHPSGAGGGVVAGVAGDAGDTAAVELAFRIASARGLTLTAFHSFWDPIGVDEERDIARDEPGYDDQWELVAGAVASAAARHPDVEVRHRLSRGFADERLLRASRGADLLVVGHRRKPFLSELVYGSVAPHLVEHAHCSVAVVPYREQVSPAED
jgi:nucleotide-binding universal stress UspA family protein